MMAPSPQEKPTRYRTFRYRLDPTSEQAATFKRWIGCARVVRNAALEQREIAYHDCGGVSVSYFDQTAELADIKSEFLWLGEPPLEVLRQEITDLKAAYSNFWAKRADHPAFHRKGERESFRIHGGKRREIQVRRINRRWGEVRIPKLGWVRFRWSRKPLGKIKHLTVKRDPLGWHVSFCCEQEVPEAPVHGGPPIGLDRGVTSTVAFSDGRDPRNCPALPPKQAERLRRLERKAGRQETLRRHRPPDQRKRSNRHQRTYDAIARLKAKEARIRKDFAHKLSTDLAKNHSLVVIEKLNIQNMTRSAKGTIEKPGRNVAQKAELNHAILSQGWGLLTVFLAYKTEERGGELVKVPAFYTSQTCAECGHVDAASRKGKRFCCTACGHTDDADVNAARNILAAGLAVTARGAFGEVGQGDEPRTSRELAHV